MHHLFAYCYVTERRERYHAFSCNLIFVHQNRNNVPTKIKIHVLDSIHLIGWALCLVYEHSGNAIVQRVKSCSIFPELISLAYSFRHSPRVVTLFIALQSAAAKGVPSSTASPLPLVHTADVLPTLTGEHDSQLMWQGDLVVLFHGVQEEDELAISN
jgi:hypothetical protein